LGFGLWGKPVALRGRGLSPGTLSRRERVRQYRRHTLGRRALARSAAGAAFGTALNHPHEWGRGPAGFGRRLASGFAQHVVKNTIALGVGAWRHEVPGYVPSHRHGAWPRTKYALTNTFLVRREHHRGKSIAAGRISGAMGAGMVSRLWQPARLRTVQSGLASGGISLGADAGSNVLREFWPDIRKRMHGRNKSGAARAAPLRRQAANRSR